ncbi:MAG: PD-(D/E)XK nuclease family protein [Melioribacteraceae bacterium]
MILTKSNIEKVDLDFLINEKIKSNRVNELLIIVPTNRKVRNLKKEIISLMPNRAALELNIETLGTISTKILNRIQPFRQLSEAASIIFIKQSFAEIKPKYFSVYKNEIPFGILDRIKNVISEYKRHGITPEQLKDEAEKLERSEKLKALDIADIYDKYLNKCYSINAYEIGDVYKLLLESNEKKFEESFSSVYPDVNLIVINGFNEFTNPEIKIINRLSLIEKTELFISFDYNQKNKFIFSHLDSCFNQLLNCGFKTINDTAEVNLPKFRLAIRNELFKYYEKEKKYNYKDRVYKFSAYDRENEVEKIAKIIKSLITDEKIEPDKICVVFNLIQNYSSIVRDIFSKNGIPFNLTDRIPLDNSNPVKAIITFLEIAENDYYYQNIFRALSSGYIKTDNVDLFNLYKVSSELKIVSGKENWINIINESIENIKLNFEEDAENKEDKISSYQRALSDIKLLINLLAPFEEKQTIKRFKENLFDFVNKSFLPYKLLSIKHNQEENIRGFNKFIETISEIFDLLEEERGSDELYGIHFFMDQLRTACSWARFNVKEKSNYGVLITNLEEIRGLNFDYLFIGGLCDGDLPTRYTPEIFSSGKFRKQAAVHQTEERNLFYQALNCWNKKLFLSYPLVENGKETVVSTFLKEFEKIFLISEIKEEELSNKIFSLEELNIYAGKNFDNSELLNSLNFNTQQLIKSIKVEKEREVNIFSESIFNGILVTKDNIEEASFIKEKLNSFIEKQYSISQLETYAKCPFKFFMERIIGIKVIEEPTEDIEAIELGNILHSILYKFYTRINEEKIDIKNRDKKIQEKVKKLMLEIAEKKIANSFFKAPLTFYEKEKLTGIDGNFDNSILGKFIEYESASDDNYKPMFFEVRFGALKEEESDKTLSSSEPIQIDGLKLRGKIDRIELSNYDDTFNIVDYKLGGKKPATKELKDGLSLQLPVYLFAAQNLLEKKFGKKFSPNEMIIYSLKYSKNEFGKQKVSLIKRKDDEITNIDELINNTINHIKNYVELISKGKFNLSPHENRENIVCRFCQFKPICRIQTTI